MIPNSIAGPAESGIAGECPELFRKGTRNVLWLTVREGRRFILKGLPEELRPHPEERIRLRKEYSLGLRISHPGVAGVYGFEDHPVAGPVIVMEYVDGMTLDEFLRKGKLPDLKIRMGIARQIADSLAFIHSLGLSHRDLKPDNVMITRRNESKIIDIGLGDSEDSVIYKQSMGTGQFGAPEQKMPCVGDSRADVYSYGKLLELLLPESRFRKLRAMCLKEDPEKRISMQDAAEMIESEMKPRKKGFWWWVMVFYGVMLALGLVFGIIDEVILKKGVEDVIVEPDRIENNDVDTINKDRKETGPEIIGEDFPKKESAKRKDESNGLVGNEEKTPDQENISGEMAGESKYEKIFAKHMTDLYAEFNRLGCAYDAEKGMYIDSIVYARSGCAADISNRMISELMREGCQYYETMRLGNLMIDKAMEAIEKIDGRKPE